MYSTTIVNADRILVMEHDNVIELGNHHSLLKENGRYAQLWAMLQSEQLLQGVLTHQYY